MITRVEGQEIRTKKRGTHLKAKFQEFVFRFRGVRDEVALREADVEFKETTISVRSRKIFVYLRRSDRWHLMWPKAGIPIRR